MESKRREMKTRLWYLKIENEPQAKHERGQTIGMKEHRAGSPDF